MNIRKLTLFLVCFFCFSNFIVNNSFGQQVEKITSVVATGVGTDSNNATRNGIRAAVEQVVGTYISSETIIKNNILLEDKIYSYSDGYVKEMKIISWKTEGGLVYVKIEAKVVASELKRKLESLGMTTAKVEGESLFGEAMSKVEREENAEELLFGKLDKLKRSGLVLELGKIKIRDANRNKTKIEIPITVKWNQDIVNDLYDTILRIAKRKRENVHKSRCDTVCFTNMNLIGKDLISLTGVFDSLDPRGICVSHSMGNRAASLFNVLFNTPVRVQISLRDKNDKTVFAINKNENLSAEQLPHGYLCGICIGVDGTTNISLVDEMNTDTLKDIVTMEGRIFFPDRDHK
jgi:hypothetical protein